MLRKFLTHWRGIVLSLIGIVAILALASSGQLALYIHPRYIVFTVTMSIVAILFVLASFAVIPIRERLISAHTYTDHASHEVAGVHQSASTRSEALWFVASVVIVLATAIALLVFPPATLTSATVEQRGMNDSVAVGVSDVQLASANYDEFTVKDWAVLLRQGAGPEFFAGKIANLTGFVTPDVEDPENIFYLARFVVTCCAVDAQPVGVPVYLPGWQQQFEVDTWVQLSGGFIGNPSAQSSQALVVSPRQITEVTEPNEPYVY